MESLLEFARGPLFVTTFLFMIFGLLRQIYIAVVQLVRASRRVVSRAFLPGKSLKSIIEWMLPLGHIYRNKPVMSIISFVFHIGLLAVPLLLPAHIYLVQRGVGISWPGLPLAAADTLTIITILTALFLLTFRLFDFGTRSMSSSMDYILLLVLVVPFISGFMVAHPAWNPLSRTGMMLVHVLSSEFLFLLLPYTKLAHCVLFPFDRISSDIFWKFPVGAADKVAHELHGEEVRV